MSAYPTPDPEALREAVRRCIADAEQFSPESVFIAAGSPRPNTYNGIDVRERGWMPRDRFLIVSPDLADQFDDVMGTLERCNPRKGLHANPHVDCPLR